MCDGRLDITGRFYSYRLGCACGSHASILGFVLRITAQHQHSVQHHSASIASLSLLTPTTCPQANISDPSLLFARCVERYKKANWLTYVLYGL